MRRADEQEVADGEIRETALLGRRRVAAPPLPFGVKKGGIPKMPNQLGRRYQCETCGTMVLCTKPGAGAILCCEAEMPVQQPRKLPSSD